MASDLPRNPGRFKPPGRPARTPDSAPRVAPASPGKDRQAQLLDTHVLRERRLELGLSIRAMAEESGVSSTQLRSVEAGINHQDLTLRSLERILKVLNLSLGDVALSGTTLASTPGSQQPQVHAPDPGSDSIAGPVSDAATAPAGVGADAVTLGAALVGAKAPMQGDLLARALGWTLARLRQAQGRLDAELAGSGMQTTRTMSGVRINARPGVLSAYVSQRVLDAQASQPSALRSTQVRILTSVAARTYRERDTNDERVQLAALVNRGLIEHDRGEWKLTPRSARSIWPDSQQH